METIKKKAILFVNNLVEEAQNNPKIASDSLFEAQCILGFLDGIGEIDLFDDMIEWWSQTTDKLTEICNNYFSENDELTSK